LAEHGDALFAYAWRRVGQRELAEDMVQDTLLAAWKHRDSFRGESTRLTWLTAILRRRIIDERRRAGRRLSLAVLPSDEHFDRRGRWKTKPQDWGQDPSAQCETQEFHRVLAGCIDGLPADQAAAFKLRTLRDRSTQDCCNQLGVNASNLGVRLYRARLALRRCLELRWFKASTSSGRDKAVTR